MEKEILLEARNVIDDIYINGIDEKYIKELYRLFGNDNIPLEFKNTGKYVAAFSPKFMYISINMEEAIKWLDDMVHNKIKYYSTKEVKLLKSYLTVSLLYHEIEHSNQKLISDGKKQPNYDYKINAYHDVESASMDTFRFIIYHIKAYDLILERNASIEGHNIASSIANLSNEKKMLKFLILSRNKYIFQGYKDNGEGCLKYTYRSLGMMRKYNKLEFPDDMTIEEKAYEGLELTENERKKMILSLKNQLFN